MAIFYGFPKKGTKRFCFIEIILKWDQSIYFKNKWPAQHPQNDNVVDNDNVADPQETP